MAAPITKEEPKKQEWVSIEEADKLGKFIGRQFIKRGDEKSAKKFFFKVEAIIPYTPADQLSDPDKFRINFLIQKYHRNKTSKVDVATSSGARETIEKNAIVDMHVLTEDGKWRCVDSEASRFIDSDKFKLEFEPDSVTD